MSHPASRLRLRHTPEATHTETTQTEITQTETHTHTKITHTETTHTKITHTQRPYTPRQYIQRRHTPRQHRQRSHTHRHTHTHRDHTHLSVNCLHVQNSWQAQHFVNLHAPLEAALAVALSAVVCVCRRWSPVRPSIVIRVFTCFLTRRVRGRRSTL